MPSMPERNLYEYAVIRYVPDVEREEFVNVGLAMMCKRRRWMRVEVKLPTARLGAFKCPHTLEEIEEQLRGFTRLTEKRGHPFAEFPVEERFRWLTAQKSACLQTSRPHPGLTDDLDATFNRLFAQLVD